MRRLLVLSAFAIVAVLVALPAASTARERATGPGTLSVRDGYGSVVIVAQGSVIGRFTSGRLILNDPRDDDGGEPRVRGAEQRRALSATKTVYRGRNVRFRLLGGRFVLNVSGEEIYLSAVGRGHARVRGYWGSYSVNGGEYLPLPVETGVFQLRAPGG